MREFVTKNKRLPMLAYAEVGSDLVGFSTIEPIELVLLCFVYGSHFLFCVV